MRQHNGTQMLCKESEREITQMQFLWSYSFLKILHKITMALLITPLIDDFQ